MEHMVFLDEFVQVWIQIWTIFLKRHFFLPVSCSIVHAKFKVLLWGFKNGGLLWGLLLLLLWGWLIHEIFIFGRSHTEKKNWKYSTILITQKCLEGFFCVSYLNDDFSWKFSSLDSWRFSLLSIGSLVIILFGSLDSSPFWDCDGGDCCWFTEIELSESSSVLSFRFVPLVPFGGCPFIPLVSLVELFEWFDFWSSISK